MAKVPPVRLARMVEAVRARLARLHRSAVPPEIAMLELIVGGWVSQAIQAAATLRIADAIEDEPRSAQAIAEAVGANAEAVHRLLRALAQYGVFVHTHDGRFGHSALSETLRSTDAGGVARAFAMYVGSREHRQHWSLLDEAVITGKSRVEALREKPFFAFMRENQAYARMFDEAMTNLSAKAKDSLLAAYDFTQFPLIVDVGGGQGRLLGSILALSDGLRGVLYDLPEVIEGAPPVLERLGVSERCAIESGSFFEHVPQGGDAYLLKHVIHDWSDEQARRILRNVRAAIPATGTLLVIEGVVPEGPAPHLMKLIDLEMLVNLDGKERTEAQFRGLLASAGFTLKRVVQTAGVISVLEAAPVGPPAW